MTSGCRGGGGGVVQFTKRSGKRTKGLFNTRVASFEKTYDVEKLKGFDDEQILEKKKGAEKLDGELTEIMGRITYLVKETPKNYIDEGKIVTKASKTIGTLYDTKENFLKELGKQICERDLSAKKLQNASLLNIKLPKFKGYESPIDIYTFILEFEKLIAPNIQKRFQPDYLKRNYLDEPALTLVNEIHDMDQIWNQLKDSFGCVKLLLQNKLSVIRKIGPLYKVKEKEKLIIYLSKLINSMSDLNVLVTKHNITDQLFHHNYLMMIFHLL